MRLFKIAGTAVIISTVFLGCDFFGSSGGSDEEVTEEYSLTASASPTEGGSVNPANGSFEEGSEVSVDATAADGWTFTSCTGDKDSNENTLTFSITEDTEVTANFIESSGNGNEDPTEYSFTASANPTEGGSVNPASGSFEEGSEVSVEATAANGWAFTSWSGDMESNESILTFSITEDTEVTANFFDRRSVYTVDMTASDGEETIDLSFGQADGATEGFDDGMDEDAPPPPPSDVLHTYFEINDLDLYKDFRSNTKQEVEWTLLYQVDNGKDLTLAWTIADDTKMEGNLTMTDESGSFEVDMLSESSYTVSGSTSGTLIISYSLD